MSYIGKLNKKLKKAFGGDVAASEDGGRLVLSGELKTWADIVRAGMMSVNKKRYAGVVNDIACTGEKASPPHMPALRDDSLSGEAPDVLVIGGGVIGCAVARELSRYALDIMLVEKEHDLAMQTSGRNDGMVHSGIDLKPGTQKHRYNKLGNRMFDEVCAELDVPFDRCGQYLCFEKLKWKPALYFSLFYWRSIGLRGTKVVGKGKLRQAEPGVSPKIAAALHFPMTGIVCPYELTIGYAENAVQNGARVFLDTAVTGVETADGLIRCVTTNRGKIYPKIVVNAAGVFAEDVAGMAGDRFYSIHPRKGTNAILDRKYGGAITRTAVSSYGTVSTKSSHSKGGGIIHTVDGNTLIGPDAVETIEKEDYTTHRNSILRTFYKQGKTSPALAESQIITYFSGIRACTYEEDFVVCKGKYVKNIVHAAGIQSPGLTAAPAIGAEVARIAVKLLGGDSLVAPNSGFDPVRKVAPRIAKMDVAERARYVAQNPDFGVIICRCEEISLGEIKSALRRNIPCYTLDGVKRRVRPGMGRCQGGFCGPLVLELIAEEKGIAFSQVSKSGDGSELLFGPTKVVES